MRLLYYDELNTNGRLCNQLFFIASSYGLARKTRRKLCLPPWKYKDYFQWSEEIQLGYYPWLDPIMELYFSYCGPYLENILNRGIEIMNVKGYFQTEKYFKPFEQEIRNIFKFKEEFSSRLLTENKALFERETIAIHVRRGDYVDNPNYHNLPTAYYILALEKFFPDWDKNYNIVVFSDDIPYCKTYFQGNNIYFSEGHSEIEDLFLLSQCKNFILSNSSYSWWGAYLSDTQGLIIRPIQMFEGELKRTHNTKDYWPPNYIAFDYTNQKINLKDTLFLIPIHYDHIDRAHNLNRTIEFLRSNFDTNIFVGEQGGTHFQSTEYIYKAFPGMSLFHRTKMLNEMCKSTPIFPIIVNYDVDVIIPPIQLLQATKLCRRGIGMVFPYDGRFARIPKYIQHHPLHTLNPDTLPGSQPGCTISHGGCVLFRRDAFIKGGMENENFISYGPEDTERNFRFGHIGIDIRRIKGPLYHYDHYIGHNSSPSNPYWEHNCNELQIIKRMTPNRLKVHVSQWPWIEKKKGAPLSAPSHS